MDRSIEYRTDPAGNFERVLGRHLPNLACLDTRFLSLSVSRSLFDQQTGGHKTRKPSCQGPIMHKAQTHAQVTAGKRQNG